MRLKPQSSQTLRLDPQEWLQAQPVDPSFETGARNALRTCLGVRAGERVVLVAERGCEPVAAALWREAKATGAEVTVHLVDPPLAGSEPFVARVTSDLAKATASMFVGTLEGLPSSFRRRVIDVPGPRRHAHMPGLTAPMMQQSMRADYQEVHALGEKLESMLAGGGVIRVETPRGTRLRVECGSQFRWYNASGLLRTAGWTNLPGGELFTTPSSVDGTVVPDGGVWDTKGEPVANADRLELRFERGRLVELKGGPGSEPEALLAQLDAHAEARRVGQVAFGTNTGIVAMVGSLLQDLKTPGFHLSLGHSCPELTGASFTSDVEVPLLMRRTDVWIGETQVVRNGRYVSAIRPSSMPPPTAR